jgi:transcriptional regulator with XRE-family HTH domain
MLAETLREARRKKGWSVMHLSKRSGVSWGVIEQIEKESPFYVPSEGNTTLLAQALSLRFNQEEFCYGLHPNRKSLVFALFSALGSRFDGRVAFRSTREAPFGPSRRPTAGFRRLSRRAHLHQKRRNSPMDPYGRQPPPIVTAFPRQTQVRNTGAG